MTNSKELIGKRIKLIQMNDDPNPIESGTMGTIYHVANVFGNDIIHVKWDNGRTLNVEDGVDQYEIMEPTPDPLPPNNFLVFSGNI
jgi:hypothetical protein